MEAARAAAAMAPADGAKEVVEAVTRVVRARDGCAAPTVGAARRASAVAMAFQTCLLACFLVPVDLN